MPETNELPTRDEQYAAYRIARTEWDRALAHWWDCGRVGNPPPMPVRPHTPGFAPTSEARDGR